MLLVVGARTQGLIDWAEKFPEIIAEHDLLQGCHGVRGDLKVGSRVAQGDHALEVGAGNDVSIDWLDGGWLQFGVLVYIKTAAQHRGAEHHVRRDRRENGMLAKASSQDWVEDALHIVQEVPVRFAGEKKKLRNNKG